MFHKKGKVKGWVQSNKWNYFVGEVWAEIFLELDFPKKGIVVEIAPGAVNKIGHALDFYGFSGTLYVIEPNTKALNSILGKYKKTLKKAKIIGIRGPLDKAISLLPEKVDVIVANHPLDDMLLGKSLSPSMFSKYFGEKYGSSIKRTRRLWNRISLDKKRLKKIKSEIIKEYASLFEKVRPNWVVISQYKSQFFQSHKIFAPDENGLDVLQKLRRKYVKKVVKTKLMGDIKHIEEPSRWLVLKNPR